VRRVAAVVLSALAIAVASTAFADDRGDRVDDSRQDVGAIQARDGSVAAQAVDAAIFGAQAGEASTGACRGPASRPAETGCQGGALDGYRLARDIDWSAVGPSTDDFATDETLRLQGARLIATYRF
jgi:hypothetical protein